MAARVATVLAVGAVAAVTALSSPASPPSSPPSRERWSSAEIRELDGDEDVDLDQADAVALDEELTEYDDTVDALVHRRGTTDPIAWLDGRDDGDDDDDW